MLHRSRRCADRIAMHEVERRSASTTVRTTCHRFAFGGVSFEMLADESVAWQLPADHARYCTPLPNASTAVDAVCSLSLDRGLSALETNTLAVWEPTAHGVRVRSARVRAEISPVGLQRFVVTARVGAPECLPALLLLLASTLVELASGLYVHATALEIAGEAVLLLGPSGAGKSTAAKLLENATCFAEDRVTLIHEPNQDRWWVWALPGGTPSGLGHSVAAALPLAAFLRVRQSDAASSVEHVGAGRSAFLLREAVEVGVNAGFREAARLESVCAVASAALAGIAHVRLGLPWLGQLGDFLAASTAQTRASQAIAEPT
jgi:hypothetical protein